MTRAWALAAPLLLSACDAPPPLPAPEILSVSPNYAPLPDVEPVLVHVSLDAVLPIRVDYGRQEARTAPLHVWIGGEPAHVHQYALDGTLDVAVPAGLTTGSHDLRVALADGRESVRPGALTLVTAAPGGWPDAGPTPCELRDCPSGDAGTERPMQRGDVTGFVLEPLEDQRRGEPFLVVIRAEGPQAARFSDTVSLTVNKKNGTVSPNTLGPFDAGVHTQHVTVTAHGGNIKLTVTDAFGAQGTSNGFKVK